MPDARETARFFDSRAAHLERSQLVDKWQAVAPLLDGLRPGRTIVEVGAGTGLYTLPLLDRGHHVTAVDVSARSLEQLVHATGGRSHRLTAIVGDFLDVDLPPADVVTFIKVLHHMPDSHSIGAALAKAWGHLRPGGRVLVFEPNGLSPLWPILYRLRGRDLWEAERNLKLIRLKRLTSVMTGLGFRTVSGYRYLVPGALAARSRLLDEVDQVLAAVPGAGMLAGNVWVVGIKRA